MKRFTYSIICLVLFNYSQATEKRNYAVSEIPAQLMQESKAIIRYSDEVLEFNLVFGATLKSYQAITILNKDALDLAYLTFDFNEFSNVSGINICIYDKMGQKVRKISDTELERYNIHSEESLYESEYVKSFDAQNFTLPFTIEISYKKNYNHFLMIPDWLPLPDYGVGIQESHYSIKTNSTFSLSYFSKNISSEPSINQVKDEKIYSWVLTNINPLKQEPFSPLFLSIAPIVYFNKTKVNSWASLGKGLYTLIQNDKGGLTDETRQKVHELIKNANSDREKLEILYEFLQKNTHYIGIQTGINYWKAWSVEKVDRLKYGDCKGLTNYMQALLNEAGISSDYVLANAGANALPIVKEFPSNQFNHLFLCVPLVNDTIWLECTDTYHSAGYLGSFTDDRDVFLIKPDSGQLIKTTAYSGNDNLNITRAKIKLLPNGSANCILNNEHKGLFYTQTIPITLLDLQKKKEAIAKRYSISDFNLDKIEYSSYREQIPRMQEIISLNINGIYSIVNEKWIIPVNNFNKLKPIPRLRSERKNAIFIPRETMSVDTISIEIPDNFSIENIPENKEIQSEFGIYKCTFELKSKTLVYTRSIYLYKGTFDKSKYEDLYRFYSEVSLIDNTKIILSKYEGIKK